MTLRLNTPARAFLPTDILVRLTGNADATADAKTFAEAGDSVESPA